MGFSCRIIENPKPGHPPLLIGHRIEDSELPTLLTYGHGDVTSGQDELWSGDLSPWSTTFEKGRIYGRGSADNKGQHSINLAALESVIEARKGTLGYNIKMLFEMSEEIGSPGLEEVCKAYREELASDLFLASDGPRIRHDMPTLFLGSRGVVQFRLIADPGNGARHSGNWGGIITNPAAELANAVATLISPTGKILADFLRAPEIPDDVARLIRDLPVGGSDGDPEVNPAWGEAGLTDGERLYGTNTLEIVGFSAGRTDKPVGAIPERAEAILQLRFVKGTDWQAVERNLREHLDAQGLGHIEVQHAGGYAATRLDPAHPWVEFVTRSAADSLGETPSVLPNLGGTIPNHCFSDVLRLPTVWLPHSYPSCKQHAPDEHLLENIVEEGIKLAAGIFWDLGEPSSRGLAERMDTCREAPLDA
ncbi:acetylornithine deacetylase/succinyl-diaminopimelate desuccinylase-like protein [Halomonas organivorans]|uniref:Acetylornithine deacetylase/succinyl-diaminopimelate desuccinylase-like protein n=2 Tax=Halomonas organivorans TaxID=257772 RepID=A0A7W5BUW2_9GAMM|nr:acetylornithine deacetylase/succinyl-diaminopimelate desuccinylase-like protein [Halomonas organivorans]